MCETNEHQIINLNFQDSSDEFNWINTGTNPIQTIDGKLVLSPSSPTTEFRRTLGAVDGANNRMRFICNFKALRPVSSGTNNIFAIFSIVINSVVVQEFSVSIDSMQYDQEIEYNIDRVVEFQGSGNASIRIRLSEGSSNKLLLDYIKATDFNYCNENIRTYFAISDIIENSLNAISAVIKLNEYKISGEETLTTAFFSDTQNISGNPLLDWKFAKANIDGSQRVPEIDNPNSFNPFYNDFKLKYSDEEYFRGKPLGTINDNDYGQGILNIGFEKPIIINGLLENKRGVFFIDIDYTKDLTVSFDVVINNETDEVFKEPTFYDRYSIIWQSLKCKKVFTKQNLLNGSEPINISYDGFLSGITGIEENQTYQTISCNSNILITENNAESVKMYLMDFGSETGNAGISYTAPEKPTKFEIEWNGQNYSTGYVGSNIFNQQLLNMGIDNSEINTSDADGSFQGNLIFNKTDENPNTAIIKVSSPLLAGFRMSGICPDGESLIAPEITINANQRNDISTSVNFIISVTEGSGTIEEWSMNYGEGEILTGTGNPKETYENKYNSPGVKKVVLTLKDSNEIVVSSEIEIEIYSNSKSKLSGIVIANCSQTMSGVIQLISGVIEIKNQTKVISGEIEGAIISIDEVSLKENETLVLSEAKEYIFTSTTINCENGLGESELIIL